MRWTMQSIRSCPGSSDEQQWIDNDVRRWNDGLIVRFRGPDAENEGDWSSKDRLDKWLDLGTWRVSFEDPRPSVFADVQLCPARMRPPMNKAVTSDAKGLTPAGCYATMTQAAVAAREAAAHRPEQVLSFSLTDGDKSVGSVQSYLKQASFWTPAMTAFATMKTADKDKVVEFCHSIRSVIVGVGLNELDGSIVVAAVRNGLGLSSVVAAEMSNDSKDTECGYASM